MESKCIEMHAEDTSTPIDNHEISNPSVLRDLILRSQNMLDLRSLQKIFLVEEDVVLSLDEVVARVLAFYGRFVPFKENSQ